MEPRLMQIKQDVSHLHLRACVFRHASRQCVKKELGFFKATGATDSERSLQCLLLVLSWEGSGLETEYKQGAPSVPAPDVYCLWEWSRHERPGV